MGIKDNRTHKNTLEQSECKPSNEEDTIWDKKIDVTIKRLLQHMSTYQNGIPNELFIEEVEKTRKY